ncbi:MAG: DUF3857 domain-containing protein, partial [Bacteroidota bacterium]
MKRSLLTLLLVLIYFISYGQKGTKWGNYPTDILEMTECPFDAEAKAFILYESGSLDYQYGAFIYKVHRRIKIFEEDEISRGIITIRYNPEIEKIHNIEGITTSYPQGKKRSIKLRTDRITEREISPRASEIVIKMPGVRKGTIVEYRYEKRSKTLEKPQDWYFQHDIPTQYSSYQQTNIPRDFVFFTTLQGKMMLSKYKDVGRSEYELSNIPSLSGKIDYIYSPADFVEKIEFRSSESGSSKSWLRFKDRYLNHRMVDSILRKGPAMAKLEIKEMNIPEELQSSEQAKQIFRKIQQQYQWSGDFNIYPDGKSNSATINLHLFTLLKSIHLRTYLVLLSTPENGTVYKKFPKNQPFDHVIVKMVFDTRTFYLDATDAFLPFSYLPAYSNKRDGFQISEDFEWTETKGKRKGREITFQQVSFENGNMMKRYNVKWDMNTSANLRAAEQSAVENHIRETFSIPDNREVLNYQSPNLAALNNQLNTQFTDQISGFLVEQQNVYLNPIPYQVLLVNPFREQERFYPIQYKLLP